MTKAIKHNFIYIVSWILLIISIINIFRLLIGWQVQIAGFMVPMWIYWVEAFIFLYLSFLGFQMKKEK